MVREAAEAAQVEIDGCDDRYQALEFELMFVSMFLSLTDELIPNGTPFQEVEPFKRTIIRFLLPRHFGGGVWGS